MQRAVLFFLAAVAALAQTPVIGPVWTDDGKTLTTPRSIAAGAAPGPELTPNGSFSADTGWTKQPGWTISGGNAICDGTNGAQIYIDGGLIAGHTYKVTYTVSSYTSGNVTVFAGANSTGGIARNAAGTYTDYQTGGINSFIAVVSVSFIGRVDNVSVRELTGKITAVVFGSPVKPGVTAKGATSCAITEIIGGIITAATCI